VPELFNPLGHESLADSISRKLRAQASVPLPNPDGTSERFGGAGVYAIYYAGTFEPYRELLAPSAAFPEGVPIYVGRAIPKGSRSGGITSRAATGTALYDRLKRHAESIHYAENLELSDFSVRFLIVDDIFIPLGENGLIDLYKPVWNRVLPGFGNKVTGGKRNTQTTSPWDTVHPGRPGAGETPNPQTVEQFLIKIRAGIPAPEPDVVEEDE
jgi:hypothetical protein